MKKILSAVLTLILLVSCCLIAATPVSAEGLTVNYDDFDIMDGIIIEYLGKDSEVIVPSYDKDGNPITSIDQRAFYGNTDINTVYICEGIIEIKPYAFSECYNLTEISLPYSLETIGGSAFRHTSIASITVPANVKVLNNCWMVSAPTSGEGDDIHPDAPGIKFTELILSEGLQIIKSSGLYFSGTELYIPKSVFRIEGLAMPFKLNEINFYICNPDCELGTLEEETQSFKPGTSQKMTYSGTAPIAIQWTTQPTPTVKVYGLKDSAVATTVNEWANPNNAWGGGNYAFVGRTQQEVDSWQTNIEKKGIYAPTQWVMTPNGSIDENAGNNNGGGDKNNNNVGSGAQAGGMSTTVVIIIAAAVLLVVIMIFVIILVVMNNNNKKRRRRRRPPQRPAPAKVAEDEALDEAIEEAAEQADEE